MPVETGSGVVRIPESTLLTILLLLARMAAIGAMVGIPGFSNAPGVPRAVLIACLTVAASPAVLRAPARVEPTLWGLGSEILIGLTAGVLLHWLQEGFTIGLQLAGGQAGFSYASTIDPATRADSTVMPLTAQLMAGLSFFAAGLDRVVILAIAASPSAYPLGQFRLDARHLAMATAWTAEALGLAVRIALPVFALLLMADVALALLSRMQAQLQLLSLAFPLKMSAALLLVAWLTPAIAGLYGRQSAKTAELVRQLIGASP